MLRSLVAAFPLVLLAAAGPVPVDPAPAQQVRAPRACFLPQTVANYRTLNDTTVYVRDLRRQVFELQTGGCRGLALSRRFGMSPTTGSTACVGETVTISTAGPSIRGENNSVCAARIVRRLTPEEVAALPGTARP